MKMARGVIFGLILTLGALPALADIVVLKDGRRLTGYLGHQGRQMTLTTADGKVIMLAPDDIKGVTLNSKPSAAEQASAAWSRAQSQIKKSDDLNDIIQLHEQVLKAYPGTPTAEAVQKSLAAYRQMQAQDYAKFRDEWMPRVKAELLLRQSTALASDAQAAYTLGKLNDAAEKVAAALAVDKENTLALTLTGLIAYRQNDVVAARRIFTQITTLDPKDVGAWNNLAILTWMQKREPESLRLFNVALQAGADNRLLLDNVTTALAKYSGARDVPVYKDLLRQYTLAETAVETKMAQSGLFRYANTWVPQAQRDQLAQAAQAVKTDMATLETQYQTTVTGLEQVEQSLRETAVAYDRALSDYNFATAMIWAYAGQYYDYYAWLSRRDALLQELNALGQRKQALEGQQNSLQGAIVQIRRQATALKAALAKVETPASQWTMKLMEPGEAQTPPPPAALQLPAAALPAARPM